MDTETLIRESQAEKLVETLGFETETGKTRFKEQLRLFSNNKESLLRRQAAILAMRKACEKEETRSHIDACLQEVGKLESELKIFTTKSDVEKDSYEQLTFSGWSWAQILNTIPFVLLLVSYFKMYAVPFLALMTPIFMAIMPYVALRYWYEMPISTDQYIQIMLSMFGISTGEALSPKNMIQGMVTLFSIVQSIVQPIQNAIHLQTIHKDMIQKAEAVEKLCILYKRITESIPFSSEILQRHDTLQDVVWSLGDKHRSFAEIWDHPFRLRIALHTLGDIEVLYRIASHQDIKSVKFIQRRAPCLLISGGVDPFLSSDTRVPFEISLMREKTHHAILTGPNRGGKSSVLRSTLLSVLFAQTFGVAFYNNKMILRPFDWIATGLRLEDRPGSASMFEREVEFSMDILKRALKSPHSCGLVLFDELFHSTNPPDGARTAHVFLHKLWKQPNVVSFISTHVFDLAHKAPYEVQKLCVPAEEKEDGSLHFTYTLKEGVCEVSSVNEILKEKGLLS